MFLKKRAQIPIEERNYAPIYLFFSGLLFLATIWAVLDEVTIRRPWKEYQKDFYDLGVKKLEELHKDALSRIDSVKYLNLQAELAKAEQALKSDEYKETVRKLDLLRRQLDRVTRDWRFARSRSDAAYYEYKKNVHGGREDPEGKKRLEEIEAEIARHAAEMDSLKKAVAELQLLANKYTDRVDSLEAEINGVTTEAKMFAEKIERMKSAPIEIRQTVLNDFERTNFGELKARVDRCVTCHIGYNDPLFADAPQPFTTHPVPELLAIHDPEKFGCTSCHRGQGPALTKGDAHGDADPFWEFPILRGKDVYAGCNSCHASNVIVKFAPQLTKAKQLLMETGCYACHDIKNYANLPKIGPDLNNLTAKVKPEWIYRWVKNPKAYNPHTRMPDSRLSHEEAEAVTAYLVDIAKQSTFRPTYASGTYRGGSAARGKELVEKIGCMGCHVVGKDDRVRRERGTSYDIAPELTWVGGKVNPNWLFDWLKNPRHYQPNTRMPSLRLTDSEARDIVAYLISLKDDRPTEPVKLNLSSAETIQKGLKVIREYGCYGCHNIKGTEKEGKVSVELSAFGSKHIDQMDFGDTKIPRTWDDWVRNKLKDSRVFQTVRIIQRMPVYSFSDEEIESLRMLLKSFQKAAPSERYQYPVTTRQQDIENGRRLTMWYNCNQCHQLEEHGGYISAMVEDPGFHPPVLTGQGAKVQEPWLHGFLRNPSVIRPWLNIRMPNFSLTDEEITTFTKYFLALSKQELGMRDYAATPVDARYLAPGKKLFEEYQCAKCHPAGAVRFGEGVVAANLAPNLELASRRLKPEWIVEFLRDPQRIQPGTGMPTFFYEGQAPNQTILNGDSEEQIKALKTYVWSLGRRGGTAAASK